MGGLVLRDIGPDGLGLLLFDIGFNLPVGVLGGVNLGVQPLLVQSGHQIHQIVHDLLLLFRHGGVVGRLVRIAVLVRVVLLVHTAHQVPGREHQGVHRGRHGHQVSVPVVNISSGRRYRQIQGLLVDGLLLILVVVDNGHVPQLPEQGDKQHNPTHHHQKNRAPENDALGAAAPGGGAV